MAEAIRKIRRAGGDVIFDESQLSELLRFGQSEFPDESLAESSQNEMPNPGDADDDQEDVVS